MTSCEKSVASPVPIAIGIQRIGQLARMLFLKIMDDKDAELELPDNDEVLPLPQALPQFFSKPNNPTPRVIS